MSNPGEAFTLGGITVPFRAALGAEQQIERLRAAAFRRMTDGSGFRQVVWAGKHRVTLSGDGWSPIGLDGLDFESDLLLQCALPEVVRAQVAAITLPTTRRSDAGYEPFGRAHMSSGGEVETPVALVGDVATCTTVAGAVGYAVWFWPQFVVDTSGPTRGFSAERAVASWQIVCEEV